MSSIAQNIPEDVICEIFTHFPARLKVVDYRYFPWYLGHICSKWRVAFLTTPQFWNYICLCDHITFAHDQRKMKRITDIVAFFLEQNPGCPFDLQCYSCNPPDLDVVRKVSHILEMLVEASARWRDVTLSIGVLEVPMLSRVKGRLQSMRFLSLDSKLCGMWPNLSPRALDDFNNAFVNAPSLTHLTLTCTPNRGWETNWTQLTSLTFWGVSVGMMQHSLSRASNIERLTVDGRIDWIFWNINDAETILLPRLAYLEVSSNRYFWMKIVNAPALQELSLVGLDDTMASDDIVSFLHRSNCRLARLTLDGSFGPNHLAILRCTPELTHLSLEGRGQAFIMMLSNSAPMTRTPDFLAQLQVLEVTHLHSSILDDGIKALIDLMLLRKRHDEGVKPIEKLRCFMIGRWGDLLPQSPMAQKLEELCSELDVQLRFT